MFKFYFIFFLLGNLHNKNCICKSPVAVLSSVQCPHTSVMIWRSDRWSRNHLTAFVEMQETTVAVTIVFAVSLWVPTVVGNFYSESRFVEGKGKGNGERNEPKEQQWTERCTGHPLIRVYWQTSFLLFPDFSSYIREKLRENIREKQFASTLYSSTWSVIRIDQEEGSQAALQ